jgi:sugar O-acyltransferase (sialic acid O-acetyltransferase NeuD family)
MKDIYAVYGASGFGREVMPLVKEQYQRDDAFLVFIDDGVLEDQINGYPVWSYEKLKQYNAASKNIVIAIANSKIREELANRCDKDGINAISIKAANSIYLESNDCREGLILFYFSLATSNIKIGRHCHISAYSYIGHDCIIGDFVTFAPRVSCNGNVIIEDHAYIGTGAVIKQGTPDKPLVIGRGAVVGMGAVVTKSVPTGVTVVGNPARPFVK